MLSIVNPRGGYTRKLHPVGDVRPAGSLANARLFLFSNNKPNLDILYDALIVELNKRTGSPASIGRHTKQSGSLPALPEELEAVEADLVINGMGD